MHKTSYFNADEKEGFKRAAEDEKLEVLDLVSVRRSGHACYAPAIRPWFEAPRCCSTTSPESYT